MTFVPKVFTTRVRTIIPAATMVCCMPEGNPELEAQSEEDGIEAKFPNIEPHIFVALIQKD